MSVTPGPASQYGYYYYSSNPNSTNTLNPLGVVEENEDSIPLHADFGTSRDSQNTLSSRYMRTNSVSSSTSTNMLFLEDDEDEEGDHMIFLNGEVIRRRSSIQRHED